MIHWVNTGVNVFFIFKSNSDLLPFSQTSLLLSWMLFGGNHHILLGEQMITFQGMTS